MLVLPEGEDSMWLDQLNKIPLTLTPVGLQRNQMLAVCAIEVVNNHALHEVIL